LGERTGRIKGGTRGRGAALDRLILDTTVLISAEKRGASLDESIGDEDDVAIAAITAAELLVGVMLANTKNRVRRRSFVEDVLATIYIVDYDLEVAREHALLLAHVRKTGNPRGAHDLIIAATSVSTKRTLVTANHSHFIDLPGLLVRAS